MGITTEYRWTYAESSKHPGANVTWCCPGHRRESEKALRAEGYREGLRDGLKRLILKHNVCECCDTLMDQDCEGWCLRAKAKALLTHVEATGTLPAED